MAQQSSAKYPKNTLSNRRKKFNRMTMPERADLFYRIMKNYYPHGVTVTIMSKDRHHTFGIINTGRVFDFMEKNSMVERTSLYVSGVKNRRSSLYFPNPKYNPEPYVCPSCGQEVEDEVLLE